MQTSTTDPEGLRRPAAEQAALRRIATLVASAAPREEIYEALTTEVGRLMASSDANLLRFEGDGMATMIGRWNQRLGYVTIEATLPVGSGTLAQLIAESGRPSRITSYARSTGPLAEMIRGWGWRSSVGAPVIVNAKVWGLTAVGCTTDRQLPAGTEQSLAAFTDLLANAIANAQSQDELRQLADEQGALRRVAELVAAGAAQTTVFDAVAEEACRLLGGHFTALLRYEPGGPVIVAMHGAAAVDHFMHVGMRIAAAGDGVVQRVLSSARAARIDSYGGVPGWNAGVARDLGLTSGVGAPIIIEGRVWGAITVLGSGAPLPASAESRLEMFAKLVATAISNTQARTNLAALADEQAALRRVAELVAHGVPQQKLFDTVAVEASRLVGNEAMTLVRLDDAGYTVVAGCDSPVPVGTRIEIAPDDEGIIVEILTTQRPARADAHAFAPAPSQAADGHGVSSSVGVPIIADGLMWGILAASSTGGRRLPDRTESRLAQFAELVAAAIADAETKRKLTVSRARVVAAADETRRLLQRDLHDGAQQHLVHTLLRLTMAKEAADHGRPTAALIDDAIDHAQRANTELRNLVRGILPASLSRGGLQTAIESLLEDMPVPIDAHVAAPRLARQTETTAYFVIAEALTNVVKHARATRATVKVTLNGDHLSIEVRDDGSGGADPAHGTGLTGLLDRVEASDGTLTLTSPPGGGTTLQVALPLPPSRRTVDLPPEDQAC